ncbi:MAG: hypothetical protein ABI835_08450 [Chloroflexota bacterium]
MNPNYRQHLSDRKRQTLITNGAVVNSALSHALLRVVFLDSAEGIAAFGDALAAGWPALLDMGATYGTAFQDSIRADVGAARHEAGELVTVSMVARMSDALTWMDESALHPRLLAEIKAGALEALQKVVFVRFPANDTGRALGRHCVNADGEIQVMLFPEDDPILCYLRDTYHLNYYEVRSSNISGSPEEPFAPGAVEYACAIAAPIVAVRSFAALEAQMIDQALYKQGLISVMRRKRFGSFPIVRFPRSEGTERPAIPLVRAGNTSPDTVARLVKGCFPDALMIYAEEKTTFKRHEYESPFETPHEIQMDLLRASIEVNAEDVG